MAGLLGGGSKAAQENPFPVWLAQNRLTNQRAIRILGASSQGIQNWKSRRPPLYILLACAAWSAGLCGEDATEQRDSDDNPFPRWFDQSALTVRQAAEALGTGTSSVMRWKRVRPAHYVLMACTAVSNGLAPISIPQASGESRARSSLDLARGEQWKRRLRQRSR